MFYLAIAEPRMTLITPPQTVGDRTKMHIILNDVRTTSQAGRKDILRANPPSFH